MPTPSGLLKKGDRLRHKPTGRVFEVVERTGNDAAYSVYLKAADGKPLPQGTREAYMRPGEFLLLEAGYWTSTKPHGTYEVLTALTDPTNDPVLERIDTPAQAKAFVLRDIVSRVPNPLDALALRNMADELDPAKQEEF